MTDPSPAPIRRRLWRITFLPGWIVLGLTIAIFASGVSLPLRYQFLPLVASVVFLGLPHGAVDHLTPERARGVPVTPHGVVTVGLAYLLLGGAYVVVWFLFPLAAFVAFLALTWVHWGQGELHTLLAIAEVEHLQTPLQRALAVASRGSIPLVVPLVAFPNQYRLVAETLVGLFVTPDLGAFEVAFTPAGRATGAFLVAGLLATSLALGFRRTDDRQEWFLDAGEVALLVSFFAVVPPILAIGLYFCVWHALRHVVRLLTIDSEALAALAAGRTERAFARFARDALPLTVGALALLGGLWVVVPASLGDLADAVGLYLVLIAALTLPHVTIVTWLDRFQGVWTSPEVSSIDS